ncbi:ATP phosphoribosyltransferase regulatory subunit [Salinithrix halophila]|uniref:ATP phosphoribosyltransferase regulatory subunit n=1 Tax=Salinithrix halophila TaxID=1485204 RepID=A0ABV8JGK6_9BACL
MAKPREFEKPTGVRDFPPDVTAKKRWVEERVQACFSQWGYREVITPTLEYFETVGGASAIAEHKLFKLLDKQGQTLVLRPDLTAPIARAVASTMREEPLPLRLCYHANVFRAQEREAGRFAEFYQSGVELVGGDSPEADAEVVTLAVESLQDLEISPIQLTVGHIGLLDALLLELTEDAEIVEGLKESLGARDIVKYRNRVKELDVSSEQEEKLLSILGVRGGREVLKQLRETTACGRAQEIIDHLDGIWETWEDWKVAGYVILDLTLVGSLDYYTGIYFEGYGAQGHYLLSGGRYDQLLEQFARSHPARGFALKTDRLIMASPGSGDRPEPILLVYPRRLRARAFREAGRLRANGQPVTLHLEEDQALPVPDRGRVIRVGEGYDG